MHYKCNITVLKSTVLYYFCVIKCSPSYSNFTRKIVIMFFSPVGYKKKKKKKLYSEDPQIIKDIL